MAALFSFIVPVYNVEQFLPRCLDSICKQTFTDYEVLLIDDGSTDESGQICDDYVKKYEQFRVVHKKNAGLSHSRNVGLSMANGKYIVFLDADDYVEKELLAKVYEQMEVQGYDICSFAARRVDEENNFLYEIRFEDMIKELQFDEESRELFLWQSFLQYKAGWEVCFHVFRRDIMEAHQICFDSTIKMAEDIPFTFEYLLYVERWIKIPDILYNYTLRKNSITKVCNSRREIEKIFGDIFEKIKQILYKKDAKRYHEKRISIFYAMFLYYYREKSKKDITIEEFKDILMNLQNNTSQKRLLRTLLKQRKSLQNILGKTEGDKLYDFVRFLLL